MVPSTPSDAAMREANSAPFISSSQVWMNSYLRRKRGAGYCGAARKIVERIC
jgi:hypothetical protein